MVVGNGIKLLKLHAFDSFQLVFQLLERQDARLTFIQGFRQQRGWLYGGRQPLDRKRFDIYFTIAAGNLLQTHAYNHALMAGVDHVQH